MLSRKQASGNLDLRAIYSAGLENLLRLYSGTLLQIPDSLTERAKQEAY